MRGVPELDEVLGEVVFVIGGECRVCGCTADDCASCVARTGEPCRWVEADLCSACVSLQGRELTRAQVEAHARAAALQAAIAGEVLP